MNGERVYFGKADTVEAQEAYRRFVAKHAAEPGAKHGADKGYLAVLISQFTESPDAPRSAAKKKEIARLIPHLGAIALKQACHVTAQEVKAWVKAKAEQVGDDGDPVYCRTTLRSWVATLKRIYRWAVESQLLSAEAAASVLAIGKLPIDDARRERDVEPVPRTHVEATLPHLTPTLAAMVRLQLLTGMRPSDLFNMTGAEIHRGGVVKLGGIFRDLDKEGLWVYVRKAHKTDRFGHLRIVNLGPAARAIVEPRLTRPADAYLFQPEESLAESYGRTALDGGRRKEGARKYNPKYGRHSYAQAIERAAARAKAPAWTPYRIRHLVAGEVRNKYGLDAVRATLGQKNVNVSARYADIDFDKAAEVARERGEKKA